MRVFRMAMAVVFSTLGTLPGAGAPSYSFEDWLVAPLRVHLLASNDAPDVHTTLAETDVHRILKKINKVWAQAGISFWLESIVREEALPFSPEMGELDKLHRLLSIRPEASRATNMFHLYFIKRFSVNGVYLGEAMFVKDSASLRPVPTGIDEPIPRVSSHEIGHALSLPHAANENQLMFRGTTGTALEPAERIQARGAARKLSWIRRAPSIAEEAAEALRDDRAHDAHQLYSRIAIIPIDDATVQLARKKASPL